ncbi:MAG TPA: porin [Chryseolinea sp.]|nr:porin [Chryseolinea sp.]
MKSLKLLICICLLISSIYGYSQDAAAPAATPTTTPAEEPAEAEDENGEFTFSGYFDTYYFANLNKPASRNNLGASGISRGFDRYVGQFQLGMLMARMSYSYKSVELVSEVGWGPNVEYGSYGNDFRYKWGTVIANNTTTAVAIKQAYVNVKPTDKLTLTLGQFGTHIGYELIDAPLNFHYSINNTFNAGIPFYHIGLKGTYAFSDKVSLMAGIVNGTDNYNDNNRGKSFIGQLFVSPVKGLSLYLNTIQGNEGNALPDGTDPESSYFGVLDFVASYQISERVLLAFWGMYGSAKGDFQGVDNGPDMLHWSGANLYVTYKFSDVFSLGTRLEHFDNEDGARGLKTNGLGTSANTYTLTGNFSIADGKLTLKPEVRLDDFDELGAGEPQQFMDEEGNFTKSSQTTVGMAAIFKF